MGWDPKFAGGSHTVWIRPHRARCSREDAADLVWLRDAFSCGQLRKVYRFVTAKNVSWDEHGRDPDCAPQKKRTVMIVKRGAIRLVAVSGILRIPSSGASVR